MPDHEFTNEVAEYLQGTPKSLDEGIAAVLDFDADNANFFDGFTERDICHHTLADSVFVCADCGWWCEAGDWGEETTDNGDVCSACWDANHVVRCQHCLEPQEDCECTDEEAGEE